MVRAGFAKEVDRIGFRAGEAIIPDDKPEPVGVIRDQHVGIGCRSGRCRGRHEAGKDQTRHQRP